jgi:hypothetical protein
MSTAAMLKPGERIHVIHRRYFDKDIRRHFVAEVDEYEDGIIRASGYVFAVDENQGHNFVRRPEKRTRLISIHDGSLLVNIIPLNVKLEAVVYERHAGGLRVTDGEWAMEIKEFGVV